MKALRQLKQFFVRTLSRQRASMASALARVGGSHSLAFREALLRQESVSRPLIAQVYKAILHREADQVGLDHYAHSLGAGASLGTVITGLIQSEEFYNRVMSSEQMARSCVIAAYEGVLGRAPDPDGLDVNVGAVIAGMSLGQVIENLIGSEEFANRMTLVGPIARTLVRAAYEGVLDRNADPDGVRIYGDAIMNGMPLVSFLKELCSFRQQSVAAPAFSTEAVSKALQDLAGIAELLLREELAGGGSHLQIGRHTVQSYVPAELAKRVAATLVTLSARRSPEATSPPQHPNRQDEAQAAMSLA